MNKRNGALLFSVLFILSVIFLFLYMAKKPHEPEPSVSSYAPSSSFNHVNCDSNGVITSSESAVPEKGLYLVFTPPVSKDNYLISLYGWTDYGDNGQGAWKGYYDTQWQLECIAKSTKQNWVACPLPSNIKYATEMIARLSPPDTLNDCSLYLDSDELEFCDTVDTETETNKLSCAGTWQLWLNGELLEEYVDAPETQPQPASHFRKIYKEPDAISSTYRVNMGVVWNP